MTPQQDLASRRVANLIPPNTLDLHQDAETPPISFAVFLAHKAVIGGGADTPAKLRGDFLTLQRKPKAHQELVTTNVAKKIQTTDGTWTA